jgi:hypothetical protein
MKTIKLFEEFINESNDFVYKDDSGSGKATKVLKLGPVAWEKVKDLFDTEGRPVSDDIRGIKFNRIPWSLNAYSSVSGGKEIHKIYGVSGDYTFGNAPMYYQQSLRGNKRAATAFFDYFINKFLK